MSYELFMEYYLQAQEILANTTFQEYGIIGLFLNSLLAATALPLPTEILTSALLIGGEKYFSGRNCIDHRISNRRNFKLFYRVWRK